LAFPPERRPRLYPDAALERLRALGTVALSSAPADGSPLAWIEEAADADVVVLDRLMAAPAHAIARLPRLRALVRPAMDVRNIDREVASAHGVLVVHGTAGWVDAVCELIFGLCVALLRFVPDAVCAYRAGTVPPSRMGRQLSGGARGAIFVNAGRGELVSDAALVRALREGPIAGAALDVGRGPDDTPDPDIAALPNVVAVPHVGGLVPEAIAHHAFESAEQVARLLDAEEPVGALNWSAATRVHELRGGAR